MVGWLGGIGYLGGAARKVDGDDLIEHPGRVGGSWGVPVPVVALSWGENEGDIAKEWEGRSGEEVQNGTEVVVAEGEAGVGVECLEGQDAGFTVYEEECHGEEPASATGGEGCVQVDAAARGDRW